MGKEGQQWDDSALLNAFDYAISKYKKMHGKGHEDNSLTDVTEDVFISNNIDAANSNLETVENESNNGSHTSLDVREAGNLGTIAETNVTDSQITEEHSLELDHLLLQDQSQNYSSSNDLDEYTKLYNQYYEIEEQRQQILQQMQHLSDVNYQYSGEASISGTNSATQEYQYTSQMPHGANDSGCPCPSQCPVTSCSSLSCPTVGTHSAGPPSKGFENKPAVENVDFVTIALGAAERALSNLKEKTSDTKEENKCCNVMEQNANSETDLSTVLHAWYSAGFYTGKYLTEKSLARKQLE